MLESQESNNTNTRGFQVGPDLALAGFSGPSKGAAGIPFVVTDTTVNEGGGARRLVHGRVLPLGGLDS